MYLFLIKHSFNIIEFNTYYIAHFYLHDHNFIDLIFYTLKYLYINYDAL